MQQNRRENPDLVNAVQAIQTRYQLFPSPSATDKQTVIVGVSGGADSVCLLHVLQYLAPTWRLDLHVAHLDHALRADSAADADHVKELAAAYGLPFHCERLQPGSLASADSSLETAARHARHHYLAQLALTLTLPDQQPIVALAHHADDQAETVLHHLVRGSGLQGLAGMRPRTKHTVTTACTVAQSSRIPEDQPSVIHFVRPLLYVRRATVLQHLRDFKLTWREDSTNTDQRYTRNYLRHTVLPALTTINPAVVDAIGRLATLAADDLARLAAYDRQLLASLQWPSTNTTAAPVMQEPAVNCAAVDVADQLVLDLTRLRALPVATQRGLLRQALAVVERSMRDVSFDHVTLLCDAVAQAASGGPHPLLADLAWSVAGATADRPALLSLHRQGVLPFAAAQPLLATGELFALPTVALGGSAQLALGNGWQLTVDHLARGDLPADWSRPDQPWRAFFDAKHIGQPVLTTPVLGQRVAPLGMHGEHKALGDLFTDQKIPVALRRQWPLLVDVVTDEILWVCGVRPGHRTRITAATEQMLCVTFARL